MSTMSTAPAKAISSTGARPNDAATTTAVRMPSAVQVLPGCGARPAAWSHKVKASWRASSSVLEQVTKTVAPGTAVVSPSGLAVSAAMTRRSSSSSSNRVPCSPIPTETIYR